MNRRIQSERIEKNVHSIIERLKLDLVGLTVYTELASDNYAWTPIIAALAKAKKVYAFTRQSRYGSVEDNIHKLDDVLTLQGMSEAKSKIEVVTNRLGEHVGMADIITNSGLLRPIDHQMVGLMKETAVVPLMYETWEFRKTDIALEDCIRKGIPVLGTKETAWPLDMMRYGGFLMSKLMFECGMEVHKDRVLVLGRGRLAANIARFLDLNGIEHLHIELKPNDRLHFGDWDAIIVAEFGEERMVIGPGGIVDPNQVMEENHLIQIIDICGVIDEPLIRRLGLMLHPSHIQSGQMTATADYLGPKVTIELNAAGLKVGEIMSRYRHNHNYQETIALSLEHEIVDGWQEL
jgi:hypothetical protein